MGPQYSVGRKVICGRNAGKVQGRRHPVRLGKVGNGLAPGHRAERCRSGRHRDPRLTHAEIAIAAAEAGKDILCEKPLANTLDEAKAVLAAVEQAGVKHMVGFNYRLVPPIALAKKFIDEGKLGKLRLCAPRGCLTG